MFKTFRKALLLVTGVVFLLSLVPHRPNAEGDPFFAAFGWNAGLVEVFVKVALLVAVVYAVVRFVGSLISGVASLFGDDEGRTERRAERRAERQEFRARRKAALAARDAAANGGLVETAQGYGWEPVDAQGSARLVHPADAEAPSFGRETVTDW